MQNIIFSLFDEQGIAIIPNFINEETEAQNGQMVQMVQSHTQLVLKTLTCF